MWYFQGTKDLTLTYWWSKHLQVLGYSDSDFIGYVESTKSTLGLNHFLEERKGTRIASSIEAEFVACYEATSRAIWCLNNKCSSKSKYIELECHVVRERVQPKKVFTKHVSTKMMIADVWRKHWCENNLVNMSTTCVLVMYNVPLLRHINHVVFLYLMCTFYESTWLAMIFGSLTACVSSYNLSTLKLLIVLDMLKLYSNY